MFLDTQTEQIYVLSRYFPYGLLSVPAFYLTMSIISIYFGAKEILNVPGEAAQGQAIGTINDEFLGKYNITNREKEYIEILLLWGGLITLI